MAECKNCGAQIDENDVKCPYCHAMQYDAAEAQYMDKLYEIEENMDALDDDAKSIVLRKIGINVLIMLAVSCIAVFVGIAAGYIKYLDYSTSFFDNARITEEIKWYDENIDELEKHYSARDFASIQKCVTGKSSALKNWKHYPLYQFYTYCTVNFEYSAANSSDSKLMEYEFTRKYRGAVDLIAVKCLSNCNYAEIYKKCTDEDKAIADGWITEAEIFMKEEIGLTREQYEADIRDIYSESRYSDYKKAETHAKKYYEIYAAK